MLTDPTTKDIQYLQMSQASAAIFSTCSKAQFFSLVVDADGNIVGTGYNGSPPGHIHCVDGGCPRAIEGSPSGGDYDNCVAAHAEANALVRTGTKAKGSTIYVGALPCWGCAKLILTAGIARLVYTEGDRVPVDRDRVLDLFAKSKIEVVLVDVVPEIGATAVKMPSETAEPTVENPDWFSIVGIPPGQQAAGLSAIVGHQNLETMTGTRGSNSYISSLTAVAQITDILRGIDGDWESVKLWLAAPHHELGGLTPVAVVAEGQCISTVAYADAWAREVTAGKRLRITSMTNAEKRIALCKILGPIGVDSMLSHPTRMSEVESPENKERLTVLARIADLFFQMDGTYKVMASWLHTTLPYKEREETAFNLISQGQTAEALCLIENWATSKDRITFDSHTRLDKLATTKQEAALKEIIDITSLQIMLGHGDRGYQTVEDARRIQALAEIAEIIYGADGHYGNVDAWLNDRHYNHGSILPCVSIEMGNLEEVLVCARSYVDQTKVDIKEMYDFIVGIIGKRITDDMLGVHLPWSDDAEAGPGHDEYAVKIGSIIRGIDRILERLRTVHGSDLNEIITWLTTDNANCGGLTPVGIIAQGRFVDAEVASMRHACEVPASDRIDLNESGST